jgi:hypothetical protein
LTGKLQPSILKMLLRFLEIFCLFLVTWIGWGRHRGPAAEGGRPPAAPPEKRWW